MAQTKNLCAQIPTALHAQVCAAREQSGLTTAQYITNLLLEYYEMKENGGKTTMANNSRTMAFQIPETLFQRIKAHLERETQRTGRKLTQREFVLGLIEEALEAAERQTLQCIEQESAALHLGTERKGSLNLQHGFLPAYPLFRRLVVAGAPFGEDYVLVKLPAVPVPPLLMGKVFFLVVGSVQVLVYFNCDLHGQGLSVYVDGDFHLPFLRSDFLQRFLNGVGRRTTAGSVYASQENKSVRMVKFHSDA